MYSIHTFNFTPRLSVNASLHRYDFNKWNLWTVIKLLLQRTNFRNICKAIPYGVITLDKLYLNFPLNNFISINQNGINLFEMTFTVSIKYFSR